MAAEDSEKDSGSGFQIGALRSHISMTIHTYHALRMWKGRRPAGKLPGIIGLAGYLLMTNRMIRGAALDDPYSDFWMLRVEEKIDDVKANLTVLKDQATIAFESVPATLNLGENLNMQPADLTVFANSPLGFLGIYLVADYDELVRKTILAHHTALIDRQTMVHWLDDGGHHLRSLFTLVQRYQYSGAKRDDFAANNAAARSALEKFGTLPQDILEGTRRSRFAPYIHRDRLPRNAPMTDDADEDITAEVSEEKLFEGAAESEEDTGADAASEIDPSREENTEADQP
ncbi:PFL_4669 family integrating conjugative element protein [Saezia sanguinis]|uniref:PFL_4669 family integrating conjugative element protein n=1 Tax=Saezia sanguinis TaxID=1965230 RepID=UPI003025ABCC